ncbi:hypothetical protein BU24DRAFT_459291 [Aaosphaeria arxii CBS 175.79]|uniref:Uncharacterized protein n=1 Tax=Aaosphaeria arxii CBS 175.79 TaxID=1450172 RepID=A0A6A5Y292_9PLEO|nr:uncharacterized protein BU24DRAFT_459291 [Aaosphaeria arxii CBS 175.79]KAF2019642.1 hypothetical protein BU24DRAFT_459291 [Aaosphaeria arxii CBS 175.79]
MPHKLLPRLLYPQVKSLPTLLAVVYEDSHVEAADLALAAALQVGAEPLKATAASAVRLALEHVVLTTAAAIIPLTPLPLPLLPLLPPLPHHP